MTNTTTATEGFKVIDSTSGVHLRDATEAEIELFWDRQKSPHCIRGKLVFAHAVRISDTESVDHYAGPGRTHIPGVWF
jgi:hypothetical protein